ncbi:hypothetical protein CPJCM30710_00800 [Clostridium polyendosporum]|uniref:Right handed beta helix domain-containing protein n=1 Tax=Clostridium polyendosporum TaxID=69208 RepID=A0A919RW44_9CLOT|nr:right-handed parallel beta-helix repeat-containing protein [Clostridium polyendosporum]GIM27414.1 hypothetical protein CPJCM30710_00800 [Clostridium polyendosporum]
MIKRIYIVFLYSLLVAFLLTFTENTNILNSELVRTQNLITNDSYRTGTRVASESKIKSAPEVPSKLTESLITVKEVIDYLGTDADKTIEEAHKNLINFKNLIEKNNGNVIATLNEKNYDAFQLSKPVKEYDIELSRWGIYNDGTHPKENLKGLNSALAWASSNGYNKIHLKSGTYLVDVGLPECAGTKGITIPNNTEFVMDSDTIIKAETNSSTAYHIIYIENKENIKITGGQIIGDKDTHFYGVTSGFEKGSLDNRGNLIKDNTKIRSPLIDADAYPGTLGSSYGVIRAVATENVKVPKFDIFFYDSKNNFKGASYNQVWGSVKYPTGVTKFRFVLSQNNTDDVKVTIKNGTYYTYEAGIGIQVVSSKNIVIKNVTISNMTGDAICVGGRYVDGSTYKQHPISYDVIVQDCHLFNCRRQGVTIGGVANMTVARCYIHDIRGTAPQFGIDIEGDIFKNENITIRGNFFENNGAGDIVNCDGKYVDVQNNLLTGTVGLNVGQNLTLKNNICLGTWIMNISTLDCKDNTIENNIFVNGWIRPNVSLNTKIINNKMIEGKITFNGENILLKGNSVYSSGKKDSGIGIWNASGMADNNKLIGCAIGGSILPTNSFTWNNLNIKNYKYISIPPGNYINCTFESGSNTVGLYTADVGLSSDGAYSFNNCKFIEYKRSALESGASNLNLKVTNCTFQTSSSGRAALSFPKGKSLEFSNNTINITQATKYTKGIDLLASCNAIFSNNTINMPEGNHIGIDTASSSGTAKITNNKLTNCKLNTKDSDIVN